MWIKKVSRAAVLVLALACAKAQAEAPRLPSTAIGEDTFVVITVNGAKLDPASVEAAAKAILGANAAMAQDGLNKFKDQYTEMTQAGAEQVTFVMSGKDTKTDPQPIVYVKMKPGSDHAAVEKHIRDQEAKEKTPASEITNEGDFLITRKKGTPLPTTGSPERVKAFADGFGSSDKAFTFVFSPTDAIRAEMKKELGAKADQPEWMKSVAPLLIDSKWISMDGTLGESPALGLTVQAADEAGAKGINDIIAQGAVQLRAMSDQMKQMGPQGAPMAQAFSAFADALKPTQTGSKISLSVDAKAVGPAVANFIPLIMMGQGGARPPAKGGGL